MQVAGVLQPTNVAWQLAQMAARQPAALAIAAPCRARPQGRAAYQTMTFRELDEDSSRLAAGLQARGVRPGHRIVLMVRPGIDFISFTFALLKAAAVVVLIDPGMGRQHLLQCLQDVRPDGFAAIPLAHLLRIVYRRRFPQARFNVTVGGRWPGCGATAADLRRHSVEELRVHPVNDRDPAAIIFTTGSTGPPKGVLYEHGNFSAQVRQIRDFYGIEPGEIDLPGFPLFALFNCAMGTSTIIPAMDPRRPAQVDPRRIVAAVNDWQVTQCFGSPAIWNVVGRYCEQQQLRLPSIKRILSAGAPVPPHVLQRMRRAIADSGEIHTPYGATEALPVASIAASQVLGETAARSAQGAGTCVGERFSEIEWRVIQICDQPLAHITDTRELPRGAIGELIVRGPQVTRAYVTRTESNRLAKIADGDTVWHRMGDVGYLDEQDRFWFCGRMAHRVVTSVGVMFTIPCEAIVNQHPHIYRSALVGIGPAARQTPVLILEPWPEHRPATSVAERQLLDEAFQLAQRSELTRVIERRHFLLHPSLPVDIRHNAKIFREQLGPWAARRLAVGGP